MNIVRGKPAHYFIRAYDLAERLLRGAGEADTTEGRHILRVLDKFADRARAKADKAASDAANPRKAEHDRALDAAMDALSVYIRTRDTRPFADGIRRGHCVTCIDKRLRPYSELQAGHWITTAKWGTKFHVFNVHAQCWGCNSKMMGNGKPKEHEAAIRLLHGATMPERLIFLSKTDTRKKTAAEILRIAEEFKTKTAQHLERERVAA